MNLNRVLRVSLVIIVLAWLTMPVYSMLQETESSFRAGEVDHHHVFSEENMLTSNFSSTLILVSCAVLGWLLLSGGKRSGHNGNVLTNNSDEKNQNQSPPSAP